MSGKNRFDLGLYRKGDDGKSHTFDHAGIVRVFCNVHHSMVAYVAVLDTPHHTELGRDGSFSLPDLPPGNGVLTIWHERAEPMTLNVDVAAGRPLDLELVITKPRIPRHRNKFGKPYSRKRRGKATESSRFSPSLGTKIFLLTAALVMLAVGISVVVTRVLGDRVADRAVTESLVRSTAVQSTLANDRLDQLYLRAESVGRDPYFAGYLAEAIKGDDVLSLTDQLEERQADFGFTFAIVLDLEGQVVARTDQLGSTDFTEQSIFTVAMDSGEYSADGICSVPASFTTRCWCRW